MEPGMKKNDIFETVRKLALVKGADVLQERIEAYTEILSKFDHGKVKSALLHFLLREKFFPDISELMNFLDPQPSERDIAVIGAGRILDAVRRWGLYQPQEAKNALGSILWAAVESMGGWRILNDCDSNATLRAQLRDAVQAQSSFAPHDLKDRLLTDCRDFAKIDHSKNLLEQRQ